jgi:hypothetical protein
MAGLVESVEHIELATSGGSNSTTFSGSQDIDQCVPFSTMSISDTGSNGLRPGQAEIYFSGTDTLNIARDVTDGTLTTSNFIIEFVSAVKVYQESFTITTGTSVDVNLATAVSAMTEAFILVYPNASASDDNADKNLVRAAFVDTDTVRLTKGSNGEDISGRFYVVNHANFTVEHIYNSWAGLTSTDTLTAAVTPGETFIIVSRACTSGDESPDVFGMRSNLGGSGGSTWDEVYHLREDSSGEIETQLAVVECDDNDFAVQRGTVTHTVNADLSTAIDLTKSMVLLTPYLWPKPDSDGVGDTDKASARIEFVDSDTVDATAGVQGDNYDMKFEVTDWVLAAEAEVNLAMFFSRVM